MPCLNESVLVPMQNAGQWATPAAPISEEAIWVRASVAAEVTERLISRAAMGDPAMLLGVRQPWPIAAAHHLVQLDVWLWDLLAAPFRRFRRRPAGA